jgi:hypothetical protein
MAEQITFGKYFKSLQIIHFALMAGVVAFGIIAFSVNYFSGKITDDKTLEKLLLIMVVFFSFAEVFASQFLFKMRLKECNKQSNFKDKLFCYRSALIVKFALVEGAAFFVIVAYFLTGNLLFLGFLILLLLVFLYYKPTLDKLRNDLQLSAAEENIIYNQDAVIE